VDFLVAEEEEQIDNNILHNKHKEQLNKEQHNNKNKEMNKQQDKENNMLPQEL
jgi:hypothetical protein